ncbi:MAG: DNA internalization-related competence protein ComEC/Rec2, partial [Burkholderiales bacterium]|nr:DNA internalization-related competence protein ComEC/Rec2 [Burkholderiales bacterium]
RWALRALLLCWVVAVGALGWGSTGWRAATWAAQRLPAELEGRTLLLTGQVANLPHATALGWRFAFEPEAAALLPDGNSPLPGQPVTPPPSVLLSWVNPPGQPGVLAPRSGERWQLAVRLRRPHGLANPHGFDAELWLWEQGFAATGYVRMGRKDPSPQRLAEAGWGLQPLRERVRAGIFTTLAGGTSPAAPLLPGTDNPGVSGARLAGVLAALVVGDQAAIERADWDVFRTTGVAHLMAISGLHITLWAWLVAGMVRRMWRWLPVWAPGWGSRVLLACPAPLAAAWGGWLLALTYAVFSGWGVPAQRTVLMLTVAMALRASGRHWPWPLVMGLAMAVVLAWDPWAWMQAGFWLSFVAVGVLMMQHRAPEQGSPELVRVPSISGHGASADVENIAIKSTHISVKTLFDVINAVKALWHTQWVMTLSLAPLTLVLFGQVSVVGFVANLVAIPVVTLVVTPLALAGVVWSGCWVAAAWVLSQGMGVLAWLAALPLASLTWPAMPWGWGMLAVVGGVVLAQPWPWRVRLTGLVCLLPGLLWTPLRPPVGEFDVLAADVGQGSGVLIRTASSSVLYDAGPQWGLHADAGQRVLRPLLQALGESPSHVVLSHRDGDHVGGALGVLQGLPDAQVWASLPPAQLVSGLTDPALVADVMGVPTADDAEPAAPDGQATPWPTQLGNRPWTRCEAGQHWMQDGVRFEFLHPSPEGYARKTASNNLSCVLWVRGARASALLTGDLDATHEEALVQAHPNLRADWLLAPHHGSKSSSSVGFLAQVQPRWVVAQAGYRNRYGHPAEPVVQRYQALGLRFVATPDCGAATWHSLQPDSLACERPTRQRYWQATPQMPLPQAVW